MFINNPIELVATTKNKVCKVKISFIRLPAVPNLATIAKISQSSPTKLMAFIINFDFNICSTLAKNLGINKLKANKQSITTGTE